METKLKQSSVRWADGTVDHKRLCDECGKLCPFPVHNDFYKEIKVSKAYKNWEEGNFNG